MLAAVAALFALPANGLALTVNQASLSGGKLTISGTGAQPGVFVMAESFGTSAGIRSDVQGTFQISASGFVSEDCTAVRVNPPARPLGSRVRSSSPRTGGR